MIAKGDRLLLIDKKGKKYMVNCKGEFHTHYGVVDLDDLVGKSYGIRVETHRGEKFTVLKPSFIDYIEKMRRMPQIITPKDAAMVIAETGLSRGHSVVEAGAGSGALTIFLADTVYPGEVHSYEIREDFAEVARENVKGFGLDNVSIKLKDVYKGVDEEDLDLVALDLPEPEKVVKVAYSSLKFGGFIFGYNPSIEQMLRFRKKAGKYFQIKTIECNVREYESKKMGTRPKTLMVGHTGFLTFGRKVF
ncbi:MAG: tRNA (adenine-N1)-methyltransferase [Euryarchaeota archaeon]|nr:tRNA (adenine-N1)-methyltransferase [Euryarchaeota archaeon]